MNNFIEQHKVDAVEFEHEYPNERKLLHYDHEPMIKVSDLDGFAIVQEEYLEELRARLSRINEKSILAPSNYLGVWNPTPHQ